MAVILLSPLLVASASLPHLRPVTTSCTIRGSARGWQPEESESESCRVPAQDALHTVPPAKKQRWCGLCGSGSGWMRCGKCMGTGGFATRPGLAGVKKTVGWARCKTCFGNTLVPCILCGLADIGEWERWKELMRREPVKDSTSLAMNSDSHGFLSS